MNTLDKQAGDVGMPASESGSGLIVPLPQKGSLSDLMASLGAPMDGPMLDSQAPLTLWRLPQGATLIHEGARGRSIYVVRHGFFKRLKTLEDGYEQVLAFMQAGEILGFEALHNGVHPSTVVALEISSVYVLPVAEMAGLQLRCPALGEALHRALSRQLMHASESVEMMAAVSSEVRVARFLVWWSSRMASIGQSPRRLRLRMCRRDLASLLGVAHETVSRSLTAMCDHGLLRVSNRDVEILDMAALHALARCTRFSGSTAADHRSAGTAATRDKCRDGAAARRGALDDAWRGSVRADPLQ